MPFDIESTKKQTSIDEVNAKVESYKRAKGKISKTKMNARQAFLEYLMYTLVKPVFDKTGLHADKFGDWIDGRWLGHIIDEKVADRAMATAAFLWRNHSDIFSNDATRFIGYEHDGMQLQIDTWTLNGQFRLKFRFQSVSH